MKVLVFNCGSSTLKFKLIELGDEGFGAERELAGGRVECVGDEKPSVDFSAEGGESLLEFADAPDHERACRHVFGWLRSTGLIGAGGPDAVGHRIVHGGRHFDEPALIDAEVMEVIESLVELAPLHNGPSLATIRAARTLLGPSVPMVAVFDTAFHSAMPEHASRYAIPQWLSRKHHVRRYGFHGTAHRYMTERYSAIVGEPVEKTKLVTLQLGNGCSAAAVRGGRSVDTSMGFTPLEGLMMGTRCGDLDPSLVGFLADRENASVAKVEDWLNKQSGLLGVSGVSRDMKDLLEAEVRGDKRASLAVEMFCHRARKYVGSYLSVLGGADAVVFGGGIGENAPEIRARVCDRMGWCGLEIDTGRNVRAVGVDSRISADNSKIRAYVIAVDEETMIAQDTSRCLVSHPPASGARDAPTGERATSLDKQIA
ncbi:MAG: acetate/propionate family kinase [Rubrobacteraceae bacterium]